MTDNDFRQLLSLLDCLIVEEEGLATPESSTRADHLATTYHMVEVIKRTRT